MRKSLVCVCIFIMAFMLVFCLSSSKATAEGDKPEKSLTTGSFNLNGKWKVTVDWKAGGNSGTFNMGYKIVQNGMEIIMITPSGDKIPCTLKGDVIHFEPRITTNVKTGVTSSFPAREYKVSQDGNTLTSEFNYTWDNGRDRGDGSMAVTMIPK